MKPACLWTCPADSAQLTLPTLQVHALQDQAGSIIWQIWQPLHKVIEVPNLSFCPPDTRCDIPPLNQLLVLQNQKEPELPLSLLFHLSIRPNYLGETYSNMHSKIFSQKPSSTQRCFVLTLYFDLLVYLLPLHRPVISQARRHIMVSERFFPGYFYKSILSFKKSEKQRDHFLSTA